MIYLFIICLIIIGFLGVKLYQKKTIDTQLINEYQAQVQKIKEQLDSDQKALNQYNSKLVDVRIKVNTEQQKLTDLYNQLDSVETSLKDSRDEYHHLINDKMKEIDKTIEEQRQKRQQELDSALEEKQNYYNKLLEDTINQCNLQDETIKEASEAKWREAIEQIEQYDKSIAEAKERFESIERTLKQYDAEQQAKLFYTIQLPDEYKDDIEFLLTSVAPRLLHKDIIYKLIWNEYIKSPFDDLVKRLELQSAPGIYKITNITDEKCYIGKSTDVKKRLTEHMKGALGLSTISDQEIHHAIKEQGFDNWTIEVITYCEKEKLNELEKYYIEFFKSQEWGYNKRAGG